MIVIDAENVVVGRMAAAVAKLLLKGESVNIVNAEKAVISGEPKVNVTKYRTRRLQKDRANPEHSPYISRRPDLFVKRIIRGMLPYKRSRGKRAFKNLKVYMGVPEGIEAKGQKMEFKKRDKVNARMLSISELCRKLGYTGYTG
ncbi:50S ribosomal protein L13 [Candidatus Micrarchaeota archaeon]|nr:MAG: 50S ribosomal protein L13 [Candidatus Micrarchaeota archaeon]